MNLWPLFRASRRTALWTTLRALLLMGVALQGSAFAQSATAARPKYIYSPPASKVVNDQTPYTVTVSFALGRVEPASVDYPVVYWYLNGNYVGQKTSTVQRKTVDTGGLNHYNWYDPYGDEGNGRLYPNFYVSGVANTGEILWDNSWPAVAGGSTALYTAYIVDLSTFTPPAQIVVAPAQPPGGSRPVLQIVRSPSGLSQKIGGQAKFFGDAQSHVNGLMQNPFGVAVDAQGMVYVADTLNHTIRQITPGGRGKTIAGLDGVILGSVEHPEDTTALGKTSKFVNKLGSLEVAVVRGYLNPSTLKVVKNSGVSLAANSRLVYTGNPLALVQHSGDPAVYSPGSTSELIVTSLGTDGVTLYVSGALKADPESGNNSGLTAGAGTLTFDVYDPYPAHGIYKERAAQSGPALTMDVNVPANQKTPADLVTDQTVLSTTSYRKQDEAAYAKRATTGQLPEPLFNSPESLATADDGSIYVADTANKAIRRIYSDVGDTRVRTLIAGSLLFSQDLDLGGGLWVKGTYLNAATLPSGTVDFSQPRGIVFDTTTSALDTTGAKAPAFYVLDFNSIKRITLNSGTIVAGVLVPGGSYVTSVSYIGNVSQTTGSSGNGVARLYSPRGMVLTSEDEGRTPVIYVADTVSHVIRKLYLPASKLKTPDTAAPADWVSEVVAGLVGARATATGTNADGNTGYYPRVLISGCSTNGTDRITVPSTVGIQAGDFITLAGDPSLVTPAEVAEVLSPGTLRLKTATASTTISGTLGTLQSKAVPKANLARLSYPSGLAIDKYRNLYFTEMGSHEIRRVIIDSNNPGVSARVQTVSGKGSPGPLDGSTGEGIGTSASFFYPAGIVYDSTGTTPSLLVADSANHSIRRVAITTTTLPSIQGNASKGSFVVAVNSTSGLQKLMPVSGVNVSPGSVITNINLASKTITLNLPVTGTLANGPLTVTQDTFVSTTALGYPGVKGNRDFIYECSEYTYQWRKDGRALPNINTGSDGDVIISGADSPSLTLSNLSERDSGPYELLITNPFSVGGATAQAALYVTPAPPDNDPLAEDPKFLAPGYAQLSLLDGLELTQLRPDLNGGVIDFALQAFVTPADAVSYQWQVYTGTISGGTAAGAESEWVNLGDTANYQNTKAASVLGIDGSGGLSLVGTNTAYLKIGGFQKSFIDYNAFNTPTPKLKLPQALFRVICFPQDGRQGAEPVKRDQLGSDQNPFLVQASYAPIVENNGTASLIQWLDLSDPTGNNGQSQQATLAPGGHTLSLTAPAQVSAYPKAPNDDPYNPLVRTQYQWMVSEKDPTDMASIPVPVSGASGDCFVPSPVPGDPPIANLPTTNIDFFGDANTPPKFYFVRYWTGRGGYADGSTRIGEFVDGSYIKITVSVPASVGSIGYFEGEITPPDAPVKVVYVNAPTESFQLNAIVASASSKPTFSWQFLPWGSNGVDPGNWKTLYVGTLSSGALSNGTINGTTLASGTISAGDPLTEGSSLGIGSISETLTRTSLSFTSISKEGASGLNKDISGLYRLTATVGDSFQIKDWVVAVRQKPYPEAGPDTYSLTSVPGPVSSGSLVILDTASRPSVTIQAKVVFPRPDTIPLSQAFDSVYNVPTNDDYIWYRETPFVDQFATEPKYRWMKGTVRVLSGTLDGTTYTINGGTLQLTNISGTRVFGTYSLTANNACGIVPNLGPDQASGGQRGWTLLSNGLPDLSQSAALVKSTAGETLFTTSGGTLFQRVAEGQTVALEIPVASSYPLRYKWSKKKGAGWELLSGYTSLVLVDSKYLLRSAKLTDSGTYSVEVGYLNGAVPTFLASTRELQLLVEPAPSPAAPKVEVAGKAVVPSGSVYGLVFGGTAMLSAVTTGTLSGGPLTTPTLFSANPQTRFYTFQWKKNGVALVGQTGETLRLQAVSKAQAGLYSVDVSGVAGTRTSPAVSVSVAASPSSTDKLWNLTVENVKNVRYTLVPSATKGLAPGTVVSINGMSSDSQTLLGWRVSDSTGKSWSISRTSKFVMPGSDLKISAVVGRPSVGVYSGFLSLEKPWNPSQEWAISSPETPVTPSASNVRGYYSAVVNAFGTLTGKFIVEGKSYPFSSPMTFREDGTLSGVIKVQAPLSNSAPWNLSGTASLDMGLVLSGTLQSGSYSIAIPVSNAAQLDSLALDMSVSTYGLPDGTTITGIDKGNSQITVSSPATLSTGTSSVAMIVGANAAATHNVMHVKLNDVVLEKTPPKMTSGQTLYCAAACNAGACSALIKFIADSSASSTSMASSSAAAAASSAGILKPVAASNGKIVADPTSGTAYSGGVDEIIRPTITPTTSKITSTTPGQRLGGTTRIASDGRGIIYSPPNKSSPPDDVFEYTVDGVVTESVTVKVLPPITSGTGNVTPVPPPTITTVVPVTAYDVATYTGAIFRYGPKDPLSCFGRGGVLSFKVSNLGLATFLMILPNGDRKTYSGYIGRACVNLDKLTPDPILPFVSSADVPSTDGSAKTDAFGTPLDITGTAVEIMLETAVRQTSSISIPIWSTGDSTAEPLFGALLISGKVLEGCLGVLSPLPVIKAGLEPSDSEYTHNYVRGYLYDASRVPAGSKTYPYMLPAKVTLSTIAPSPDAVTFPLEDTSNPSLLGMQTSMGNLAPDTNRDLALTPSVSAKQLISSALILKDEPNVAGLLSGAYFEVPLHYIFISQTGTPQSTGPSWAYANPLPQPPKVLRTVFLDYIKVSIYAATIQGGPRSILGSTGGAAGFLIRGAGGLDSLKNVLGNGSQDPFLKAPFSTYRTEGIHINVYEPN